jgi:hypothetical protein
MDGLCALSSTRLLLVGVSTVSAQRLAPHMVFPLTPIPSERWIEVLSGDPANTPCTGRPEQPSAAAGQRYVSGGHATDQVTRH